MRNAMKRYRFLIYLLVLGLIVFIATTVLGRKNQPEQITATVETGTVQQTVSVSGMVEATQDATLSFPRSGVITDILVDRGDVVEAGAILATIASETIVAERAQAAAAVTSAVAARDEIVEGQTEESAEVTETTVTNAVAALDRAQELATDQVETALRALLSSDLEALSTDSDEPAIPPTISGTYTCNEEGAYTISVFGSNADSGYSYRLSGLETDSGPAPANQPGPLGDCGLFIQFIEGQKYASSEWEVAVPNTRSATYITRKNAYDLAVTQAEQNVQAARDALALATNQASVETAAPRVEDLLQANAAVQEAQARLQTIDAQLADFSITAPFPGIVTDVMIATGEISNQQPAIALVNSDAFELIARVPEIDVTKIALEQEVAAIFDAKQDETVAGTISFVAPQATEIDGVGYFETIINFITTPEWMRAGLNADIDIRITEKNDVLRLPQRFIDRSGEVPVVLLATEMGDEPEEQVVELGLMGNDGFVEVLNLPAGTEVIAP